MGRSILDADFVSDRGRSEKDVQTKRIEKAVAPEPTACSAFYTRIDWLVACYAEHCTAKEGLAYEQWMGKALWQQLLSGGYLGVKLSVGEVRRMTHKSIFRAAGRLSLDCVSWGDLEMNSERAVAAREATLPSDSP